MNVQDQTDCDAWSFSQLSAISPWLNYSTFKHSCQESSINKRRLIILPSTWRSWALYRIYRSKSALLAIAVIPRNYDVLNVQVTMVVSDVKRPERFACSVLPFGSFARPNPMSLVQCKLRCQASTCLALLPVL